MYEFSESFYESFSERLPTCSRLFRREPLYARARFSLEAPKNKCELKPAGKPDVSKEAKKNNAK